MQPVSMDDVRALRAIIERHVLVERERCARIAESYRLAATDEKARLIEAGSEYSPWEEHGAAWVAGQIELLIHDPTPLKPAYELASAHKNPLLTPRDEFDLDEGSRQ